MADELTLESLKARWSERDKLIDVWAERVIDGMDMDTLIGFARDQLMMGMDDLEPNELIEQLDCVSITWDDVD